MVTPGYGFYWDGCYVKYNDYVTAARTADGTLVMAYMPTLRMLTVDLSQLNGPATARWYDPSVGVYTPIPGPTNGLFPNGAHKISRPRGNNNAGDDDWVLVLATAPTVSSVAPDSGPAAGGTTL